MNLKYWTIAMTIGAGVAAAQTSPQTQRMILRTGVTCHTTVDAEAPIAGRYNIGHIIGATQSKPGMGGRLWYFDRSAVSGISPTCWIDGAQTIPYDSQRPDIAYAAVADSLLARKDAKLTDLVELVTRFEERSWDASSAKSLSGRYPLVAFKRLLLIERAAGVVDFSAKTPPLERAWAQAHRDVLSYVEGPNMLVILPDLFLQLADSNRAATWAEDAAWIGTQHQLGREECYASCHLDLILTGPREYWARYPAGRYVKQTLLRADTLVQGAIATAKSERFTRAEVEKVRAALPAAASVEKSKVLQSLADLERLAR